MGKKIKITWSTYVREEYESVMDYEDFATIEGAPSPDEIRGGELYIPNWDDEGANYEESPVQADVTSREIIEIKIGEE